MRDILPNGAVIEGTLEQINVVRRALNFPLINANDGVHYESSSRGLMLIKDMDEQHIRNAIRKRLSSGIANIDTRKPNTAFLTEVHRVLGDFTLLGLLRELQSRTSGRF